MIQGTYHSNKSPYSIDSQGSMASMLVGKPASLRQGRYYIIGQHLHGAYKSLEAQNANEPAWVNEYSHLLSQKDDAGEERLQQNLMWLCAELGTSLDRVCQSHFVPDSVCVQDLVDALPYWPVHLDVIKAVQPDVIITYGISDLSPFWLLYEQSEALGDSWEQVKAGQGNWRCKSFTGQYHGRRIPVVGLPHLSRYKLSGKTHVVEWINELKEKGTF